MGVILLLCPLRKTIVYGFPLGLWSYLSQDLDQNSHIRYKFYFLGGLEIQAESDWLLP